MIELDESFGLEQLSNERKLDFEMEYNKNRVSSCPGHLYITADKVYFLVDPAGPATKSILDMGKLPKSWCIDISEIDSYRKYGLGGFLIKLKDGHELRFTNVFRKLRNSVTEALDERRK